MLMIEAPNWLLVELKMQISLVFIDLKWPHIVGYFCGLSNDGVNCWCHDRYTSWRTTCTIWWRTSGCSIRASSFWPRMNSSSSSLSLVNPKGFLLASGASTKACPILIIICKHYFYLIFNHHLIHYCYLSLLIIIISSIVCYCRIIVDHYLKLIIWSFLMGFIIQLSCSTSIVLLIRLFDYLLDCSIQLNLIFYYFVQVYCVK